MSLPYQSPFREINDETISGMLRYVHFGHGLMETLTPATHRQSQRVSDAQHGTSPMKLKKKHTLFSLVLLAPRSRFAGNTPSASGACCAKLTENSYGKVKFGSEQFSRSCELTEQKTNFEFPKIRILHFSTFWSLNPPL